MRKNILGILVLLGISVIFISVANLWISELFTRVMYPSRLLLGYLYLELCGG